MSVMLLLPSACLIKSRVSNGQGMLDTISAILRAQASFRKHDHYGIGSGAYANARDGVGLPDLYELGGVGSGGNVLGLIDIDLAEATGPRTPYRGYYFVSMTGTRSGPYDYTVEWGVCAVPAKYDPDSSSDRYTYVFDVGGLVYEKDTRGKPVLIYPDIKRDGWRPFGSH